MFWELCWEIFKNPIGFIVTYYLSNLGGHVMTVFSTSILSSLIVFPLTLIGINLFKRVKGSHFKKVIITSIEMTIFTSILVAVWSFIFNPQYAGPFASGILPIIIGFIVLNIITILGIEIGILFSRKMQERWTMPDNLRIYLAVFAALFILLGVYTLYVYIGSWIKGIQ